MIEMDHMVLHRLKPHDQVSDDAGVVRYGYIEGIFDRSDGSHCMDCRTYAAKTGNKGPGIPRVPALHHDLDASPHCSRRPCIGDLSSVNLGLDPQMTFDSCQRVNYNLCHIFIPPLRYSLFLFFVAVLIAA